MPGGIRIFADALGIGTKELLAQVESGKLLAEDVLPKVARQMKKVAAVGLEQKMLTARVAQGKFFKELESSQDLIFKSGFGEGVGEMFNELTLSMRDSEGGMKGLSKFFNMVFKVIGELAKAIIPVLTSALTVLGNISETLVDVFSTNQGKVIAGIAAITVATTAMSGALATSNFWLTSLLKNFVRILAPIIAVVVALEDLMANFDDDMWSSLEVTRGKQFTNAPPEMRDFGSPALNKLSRDTLDTSFGNSPIANMSRFLTKDFRDAPEIRVYIDGTETAARKMTSQQASQSQVEGR